MPLTGSGNAWAATISSAIIAANPDLDASEQTTLEDAWKLICGTHATHIVVNTLVATAVTGTLPPGPVAAVGVGTVT